MNSDNKNIIKAKVSGDSMLPLYFDGEIIEIDTTAYLHKLPQVDDDILFKHPYQKQTYLIKRIAEVTADGDYYVLGLNPSQSTDSRSFGAIKLKAIVGKLIKK